MLFRSGLAARADLAALLPRQVVYTGLLPAALREAVAQAAPPSRGWMDSLAHAGFRFSHHVDIIDGGPVFEAHTDTWCAQD